MSPANRPALLALVFLLGITLTATALAQVGFGSAAPGGDTIRTDDPLTLTPVDQGSTDLGGLNTSNRLIPIDLQQPLGFGRIYEAPDSSGRLMRVSGGLSAVFSRSEYAASAGFIFPVIPAGTEFVIGPMAVTKPTYTAPSDSIQDARFNLSITGMTSNRIDGRKPLPMPLNYASPQRKPAAPDLTLHELLTGRAGPEAQIERPRPMPPSIWSSERYRKNRIASLLERAMEHRQGI